MDGHLEVVDPVVGRVPAESVGSDRQYAPAHPDRDQVRRIFQRVVSCLAWPFVD